MGAKEVEAGKAVVTVSLRDQVGRGLAAMERRLSGFGRSMATFGGAMLATGASALAWPLKLAADMEQTGVAFEVMVGDADKAKKLMGDLQKFAASTPFGFTELAEGGRMLMSYGIAADDVMGTLKLLGDVSGGNAEKLQRLTLAYGQVQAKGRLMGGEVIQMVENGFNPLQEISRTSGKSVAQLTKEMEGGGISAAMVTQAFMSATAEGGRFHGMMDKQSKTLWGLWSALMDNVAMGARAIGDALMPILKPAGEMAITLAQAFAAFIEKNAALARVVGLVAIGITVAGAALVGIGLAAMAAATIFGGLAAAWGTMLGTIAAIFSPVGLVVALLIGAGVAAWNFRDAIGDALAAVAEWAAPAVQALAAVWDVFKATFEGILGALMGGDLTAAAGVAWLGFVAAAWTAIAELGTVLQTAIGFLEAWIPGVGSVRDSVVSMFAGIGKAILAGRWDLAGEIMMAKLRLAIAVGWGWISNFWAAGSTGIGTIWDTLVYGIRTGWNIAVMSIAAGMLGVVTFVENSIGTIQTLFDALITSAKQIKVAITGLVSGSSAESDKMIAKLNAEYVARRNARNETIGNNSKGRNKALMDQFGAEQNRIGADYNKSVTGRVTGEQATNAANAARIAAAQQSVAELERQAAAAAGGITAGDRARAASAELNKALAAAADERAGASGPDGLNIKAPSLAKAAGQQMAKVESRGTFSAAAAAMFGARSSAPEQTARNTAKSAKLLQVIADKPGPEFS